MELFGHRGAADDRAALENAHRQARAGEVRRTGQPVVAAADDDGVEDACAQSSAIPGDAVEKPAST
jgi:hypothetical protein